MEIEYHDCPTSDASLPLKASIRERNATAILHLPEEWIAKDWPLCEAYLAYYRGRYIACCDSREAAERSIQARRELHEEGQTSE